MPQNTKKLSNSAEARKQAILGYGEADFTLKPDLSPSNNTPLYALSVFSEVEDNNLIIKEEAQNAQIDSDFVRAIIYVETTQGYYDRIFLSYKTSIRPMNIQHEYWKDLGYSKEDLNTPRLNIRAGIDLIKRIQLQSPKSTLEEVATLYNDLAAKRISDYGALVLRTMKEKPWLKKK